MMATCPVCGLRALGTPWDEGYGPPAGWVWSCGEVGYVCDQGCAGIASTFGLRKGNRRPDDDYLLGLYNLDNRPQRSAR